VVMETTRGIRQLVREGRRLVGGVMGLVTKGSWLVREDLQLKGTVWRDLRGVKSGINR
jgi:hypothetical protein